MSNRTIKSLEEARLILEKEKEKNKRQNSSTKNERQKAYEMYALEGMSIRAVAIALGRTQPTVSRWMKQMGVRIRGGKR